ncbi:MAG TPA: cob(I)yrinic acid a,c-diamide adenosyltransferase [Thermoanaerobaculaceae bacterium]|nr:cob(I)yrinic acid a,c-diamide adenosyltransferase [Thermoanaerobaculaceae bacterium]
MKVYTRTGDDGSTGLGDGSRVSKASLRVAVYGDVDELNAVLGVLRAEQLPAEAATELERIQALLFEVGAFLADPRGRRRLSDDALRPVWAETWIDAMEADLPELRNFVLPAGTRGAALAHLARTVCRRAERGVVALAARGEDAAVVVPLLNRLSDALFVLARWLNRRGEVADVLWAGRS